MVYTWKAKVGLHKEDVRKAKERAEKEKAKEKQLRLKAKEKEAAHKLRALKAKEARLMKEMVALAKATEKLEKDKAKIVGSSSLTEAGHSGASRRRATAAVGRARRIRFGSRHSN